VGERGKGVKSLAIEGYYNEGWAGGGTRRSSVKGGITMGGKEGKSFINTERRAWDEGIFHNF